MRTFLFLTISCLLFATAFAQDGGPVQLPCGDYDSLGGCPGTGCIFEDTVSGTFSPEDSQDEYDMEWSDEDQRYNLKLDNKTVGWISFTPQHEGYWSYTMSLEDGKKTGSWRMQ